MTQSTKRTVRFGLIRNIFKPGYYINVELHVRPSKKMTSLPKWVVQGREQKKNWCQIFASFSLSGTGFCVALYWALLVNLSVRVWGKHGHGGTHPTQLSNLMHPQVSLPIPSLPNNLFRRNPGRARVMDPYSGLHERGCGIGTAA